MIVSIAKGSPSSLRLRFNCASSFSFAIFELRLNVGTDLGEPVPIESEKCVRGLYDRLPLEVPFPMADDGRAYRCHSGIFIPYTLIDRTTPLASCHDLNHPPAYSTHRSHWHGLPLLRCRAGCTTWSIWQLVRLLTISFLIF
jgi:hypothetical protein